MGVRDHDSFVIEEFNGLWARGDAESAPSDHFIQADNVQFFNSGVETRPGINIYQNVASPLVGVVRIYNYVMQTGQSLLIMTLGGKIYHLIQPNGVPFLVLDKPGMTDFGFVAIAGRAYITPITARQDQNLVWHDLGMENEFIYVYDGKQTTMARVAAGGPPTNNGSKMMIAYNSTTTGTVTKGVHIIAVSFNDTQILGPEVFAVVESPGLKEIQVEGIPIGPAGTVRRRLSMTKAIDPKDYNAAQRINPVAPPPAGHDYHLVATVEDNILTSAKINISDEAMDPGLHGITGANPPVDGGALRVSNTDIEGHCDFGFHLVGVVYETDSGYLSSPGPQFYGGQTYVDVKKSVRVWNIPVPPDPTVVIRRHLVSTKWIPEYNGDQKGYQFFFIPKGVIEDLDPNTGLPLAVKLTEKVVNYYDSELISDASHLIDNFTKIPAMVNLNTYHSRMVMVGDGTFPLKEDGVTQDKTKPDNRSVAWLSAPGEPEAVSRVDGLIVTPLDGNPLTNCQEFRDILYLFKKTRTYGYSDNQDVPSSWQEEVLDQGIGAPIHGIATVLDSGGVNIDFLLITDWSGLMLFNGTYALPELSWKIEDMWLAFNRNNFRHAQVVNDTLSKEIWITAPEPDQHIVLHADYRNGLDAKNIQWSRWIFDVQMTTVTLIETNKVVFGSIANKAGL